MLILMLVGIGFVLKFSDHLLHTHNMRSRLDMWKISLQGFRESPLLGVGPENFGYLFDKYHPGQYAIQGEQWIDNAHNIVFNTLSESGIIGVLSFFVMVFILFQCAYRQSQKRYESQVLLLALTMLYIEQLFILNPISQNIPQFLIIAYFSRELPSIQIANIKNKLLIYLGMSFICLVISVILYTGVIRETYKHYQFSMIYRGFPQTLPTTSAYLDRFFEHPPIRYTYLVQKMATDLVAMALPEQLSKQAILKYQNLIIHQLSKSIASNPKNIRTQVILGGFYTRFDPPKAIPVFLRIIHQAPRKPMNYVYLAHAYLRVGNKEQAEANLKFALSIDPTFGIAKMMLDQL